MSWDELVESLLDDCPLVLVTLEGLVNMKLMKVTCNGRLIDVAELPYIFKKIVYNTEWFTRHEILHRDDNVQIYEVVLKYHLLFKFEGKQSHISLSYDNSDEFILHCEKWFGE